MLKFLAAPFLLLAACIDGGQSGTSSQASCPLAPDTIHLPAGAYGGTLDVISAVEGVKIQIGQLGAPPIADHDGGPGVLTLELGSAATLADLAAQANAHPDFIAVATTEHPSEPAQSVALTPLTWTEDCGPP